MRLRPAKIMSNYSTSERDLPEAAAAQDVRLSAVTVSPTEEPGAGLAFPGEDRGLSLAEMATRDLDAALQLLADRAQYITGASGAAIALRHEGERDMLCRASAGQNAPELGALLSAEFGLSGESVRTQRPLRCDDAEHDERVNRESCRDLGIASVAVVPVVSDGEVLGVFELFSGKINAFGDRDVSALERLAEMVETAARHARAAGVPGLAGDAARLHLGNFRSVAVEGEAQDTDGAADQILETDESDGILETEPSMAETQTVSEKVPATKPLLWSASESGKGAADDSGSTGLADDGSVPLALKALRKCEACGFPVSEGRRLCLDCDEKDWQGRNRVGGRGGRGSVKSPVPAVANVPAVPAMGNPAPVVEDASPETSDQVVRENAAAEIPATDVSAADTLAAEMPILSVALETSPSWWSRNKYVLVAIVVVALAIAAVAILR